MISYDAAAGEEPASDHNNRVCMGLIESSNLTYFFDLSKDLIDFDKQGSLSLKWSS